MRILIIALIALLILLPACSTHNVGTLPVNKQATS